MPVLKVINSKVYECEILLSPLQIESTLISLSGSDVYISTLDVVFDGLGDLIFSDNNSKLFIKNMEQKELYTASPPWTIASTGIITYGNNMSCNIIS